MTHAVRVTVPASTSNLGPGFDTLGLALNLRNEFSFQVAGGFRNSPESSIALTVEGRGEGVLPTGRGNLVIQAAEKVFARAKEYPERLSVRLVNRVPLASGMGSSATAIVGGLVAANELCGRPFSTEQLLAIGTEMEGHPDNVTPALYGGLTISVVGEDGQVHLLQPRPRNDLICVFCVPGRPLPTRLARRALPKRYTRADAVFSLSRAAMLSTLLQGGNARLFRVAMQDRLHQPYRAKLMPGLLDAVARAQEAGALGACFSGSGPTILALVDRTGSPDRVGHAMARAFESHRIPSEVLTLNISRVGARVTHA